MAYEAFDTSSAQKRLYLINQLHGDSILYNMTFCWLIEGHMQPQRLETAIHELIRRHESLRTSFSSKDGEIFQKVHNHLEFQLNYREIEETSTNHIDPLIDEFVQPFDLADIPLWRIEFVQREPGKQLLLFDIHHIICDGVSMTVMINDLMALYTGKALPELEYQYVDFTTWQNRQWQNEKIKRQEQYWLNVLGGELPVLEMPLDYRRSQTPGIRSHTLELDLDRQLTSTLYRLADKHNTTLFVVLLSLYAILLSKTSGQEDLVVGTPVTGRTHPEFEVIIGMFVNTLALRNRPTGSKTFSRFLREVSDNVFTAFENQDYPFEMLVEKLHPQHRLDRNPLFDAMFALQNFPRPLEISDAEQRNLKCTPYEVKEKMAKFDVELLAVEKQGHIEFKLRYRTSLFRNDSMERFLQHFFHMIKGVVNQPLQEISHLEITGEEERAVLLHTLNDTSRAYPKDKTIQRLFAEQVGRIPDNLALYGGMIASLQGKNGAITYKELNEKSHRVARLLEEKGVKADTIVGIMIERSLEMIIGILGILKAGGAYLPIDPGYPEKRIRFMLKDSGAKLLVTTGNLTTGGEKVRRWEGEKILLEEIPDAPKNNAYPLTLLPSYLQTPANLAYTIYTSGSTGKPKGVLIQHQNVVRLVRNSDFIDFTPGDRLLLTGAVVFDINTFEIWWPLSNGLSLFLADQEVVLDAEKLGDFITRSKISVLHLIPQLFNQLAARQLDIFSRLRCFLVGGDLVRPQYINRLRNTFEGIKILHMYGPTENTVFSTFHRVNRDYETAIPIGKPISNSTVYILDRYGHLQPLGVAGELCTGGDGVARGYLNNPELTAARFYLRRPGGRFLKILPPWTPRKNFLLNHSPIYRTGDLARWLWDGNIEFLGRIDQQVKIRGIRIELGEIENQLLDHPTVKEAVVIALPDQTGDPQVYAYVTSKYAMDMDIAELKGFLASKLPNYMIPSYLGQLGEIPLTPTGKIDKKKLPLGEITSGEIYTAPRNEIEKKLVEVWSEVLSRDARHAAQLRQSIGIHDHFFQLGGDSIKAIQVSAKLKKHGLDVKMNDLFLNPVIKDLAKGARKILRGIPQDAVEGNILLTPIQHRFFSKVLNDKHHFNQALMVYRKQGFSETLLPKVFTKLVQHHDALRMVYRLSRGETGESLVVQRNRKIAGEGELFHLEVFHFQDKGKDHIEKEIQQQANRIQRGMDLQTGPLVKLGLFKTGQGDHLLMVIHHLVVDGVSWRILLEDFSSAYNQLLQGKAIKFPDKTDSFQYWSGKLNDYAVSTVSTVRKEWEYWREVEGEAARIAPLTVDHPISSEKRKSKNTETLTMTLSEQDTHSLLKEVNRPYNTEINDILLTALGMAIRQWSGQDKLLIDLEGHGRESILGDIDIGRTIGWFTTQYPVILDMSAPGDLSHTITQVKETIRRIPNKGIGYGLLKYLTPAAPGEQKPGATLSSNPGISFNYLGQLDREMNTEFLQISPWKTGDNTSPEAEQTYTLDINGMVLAGRFALRFSYNPGQYDRTHMEALVQGCRTSLLKILNHCREKSRELTPPGVSDEGELADAHDTATPGQREKPYAEYSPLEIEPAEEKEYYPTSASQKQMFILNQFIDYGLTLAILIEGPLDRNRFEQTFQKIVRHHDSYRTSFEMKDGEPVQIIHRIQDLHFEVKVFERPGIGTEEDKQYIRETAEEIFHPFDLAKAPLIRVALLKPPAAREEPREHIFLFNIHHIISDGTSLGTLVKEFMRLYTGKELPGLSIHYKDFSTWERKFFKTSRFKRQEEYWLKRYQGEAPVMNMATEYPRPAMQNFAGSNVPFKITGDDLKALKTLAAKHDASLYMVLMAVYNILLFKYTNQEDIVVGTIIAGREQGELQNQMGIFINTLAIRNTPGGNKTFHRFLKEVKSVTLEAYENQHYPFGDLLEKSGAKKDLTRTPLFDAMMIYQNLDIPQWKIEDLKFRPYGLSDNGSQPRIHAQHDMTIWVDDKPGVLEFQWEYCTALFSSTFIERLIGHFLNISEQVVKNPEIRLSAVEMMGQEEKKQVLVEFNTGKDDYPLDKGIDELFREQVRRVPDHIALAAEKEGEKEEAQLSYHELHEKANRLAQSLKEKGVTPDTITAIMVDRSIEMILGVWGVLKAGGAYLPLDADYPAERINYMLADSRAKVLLAAPGTRVKTKVEQEFLEIIDLSTFLSASTLTSSSTCRATPKNLVYIIYTSGSTGKPKGVMVQQGNLVNAALAWRKEYRLLEIQVNLLQIASFSFDVFAGDFVRVFINGGKMVICPEETRIDPPALYSLARKQRITLFEATPSLVLPFMEYVHENRLAFDNLQLLIVGSESFRVEDYKQLRSRFSSRMRIINSYGVTEAAIDSSYYEGILEHITYSGNVPIGKPMPNMTFFMRDPQGALQPIGVPGELCIGGAGVTRGYLNNPELTAKKFVFLFSRSHRTYNSPKIYCTGDLARWRGDGNVEFLGRIDHQVKIRGYRIETQEIENQLLAMAHHTIKEAVVTARKNKAGENYLCAYIVPGKEIDLSRLKKSLALELPNYMIPAFVVTLERIPLTPSGKIDRKALPEPELNLESTYTPPRDAAEKKLAGIWQEILNPGASVSIGIDDNFIALGGHSLKATILASKIHKALNVKVSLTQIFKNLTIRGLSEYIKGLREDRYTSLELVEKKEYYPLSSAQKRLYFIQHMDIHGTGYNIPWILPFGTDLDSRKMESAFKKLMARHESLRTAFILVENQPVQRVYEPDEIEFALEYYDLTTADPESTNKKERNNKAQDPDPKGQELRAKSFISSFIRPFDLSRAPLMRSGIIKLPDGNHTWMLDVHHIASDGSSQTILAEDLLSIYEGKGLTPSKLRYKDFSHWQNRFFESEAIKAQEEYWLKLYADSREIPHLHLPCDFKRPGVFTFAGDYYYFTLDREETIKFKALGAQYDATLYMNILAALNTLLYRYTGQTDMVIGTGIAGRPHHEIQHIIGMFVNTLAMRNRPAGDKTYRSFLKEVAAGSIKALENQDVQFEELVDKLEPERDPSRNPLFDITMVVQNFRKVGEPNAQSDRENFIRVNKAEQLPTLKKNSAENPWALQYGSKNSKFDMTFFIHEIGDDVHIELEYYTGIFKLESIQRFVVHFMNVIKAVNNTPSIRLKDIEMISPREKEQILYAFNDTTARDPIEKTLHELFSEQVEQTPDQVALVGKTQVTNSQPGAGNRFVNPLFYLTYRELDRRANRMANYLYLEKHVQPNEAVGVLMERSNLLVTVLLGILKAGAAYVPLDPDWPEERLRHIIADAVIRIVLSQTGKIKTLNRLQWECPYFHTFLCLDSTDIYREREKEKSALMDETLWEYIGESALDDITGGGWLTGTTGQPFTREEMDEYGDNVLKKLKPLLHRNPRVLEIGCASGITMYRIAPLVGFYYGTDLSRVIIEKTREQISRDGHANIKLDCLPAHEIHKLKTREKGFDLVIINSVIQSFHGHNYLRSVIRQVVDVMADNGFLFIGDIMDQEMKGPLIGYMKRFKQASHEKTHKTKTDWSEELFLSRAFFEDLTREIPGIQDVEFSAKIHTLENELTLFRYDALLKVDKKAPGGTQPGIKPKHKYQEDISRLQKLAATPPTLKAISRQLAYVIYTSGSSGKPKGVIIEHANVVRLVKGTGFIRWKEGDRLLPTGSIAFDISTFEIWAPLLNGISLVLVDKDAILNVREFERTLHNHQVTHLHLIPQLFAQLAEQCPGIFKTLRYFLVGGDLVRPTAVNEIRKKYRDLKILHMYGPTENTTFSTFFPVERAYEESLPLGKPIADTAVYILDKYQRLQPIGVYGELCIGGRGVALGYLNNPELTQERFRLFSRSDRPDRSDNSDKSDRTSGPYPAQKLYKTGDLARWNRDGQLEFAGRLDRQVKIRGFRVETGEIENRLLEFPEIKEAVVTPRQDDSGDLYLCAYVVPDHNRKEINIEISDLKQLLSAGLPDYMIPSVFVTLPRLPLTSSGKVDRKSLPEPRWGDDNDFKAPRNRLEETLARIWSEILGLDKENIGIDANFFQLGGHSLKATILINRIHKELEVQVPLAEIFTSQTIRGLAQYVEAAVKDKFTAIEPVEEKEYYPLSSAQKRLYFLQQMDLNSTGYNMPLALPVGKESRTDKLESLLKELIARHESLRTTFVRVAEEPVQKIYKPHEVVFELEYYEPGREAGRQINNFIRPFDLSHVPLMRSGIVKAPDGNCTWLVDLHHIVTDGSSQMILTREFISLYNGQQLEPLRLQYRDFSQWQNHLFESGAIKPQEEYWLQLFSDGEIPRLDLAADHQRPEIFTFAGDHYDFVLDSETVGGFKALGSQQDITLYMNMLALLNTLFFRYTGQTDIIIGSGIAGRPHSDLQHIIGMFVNMLALRNRPTGEITYHSFLKQVKTASLNAFANQDIQFENLIDKLDMGRDLSRNPLFDISMVVQNLEGIGKDAQQLFTTGNDRLSPVGYDHKVSKFDLTFYIDEVGEDLQITIEYYTGIFKPETVQRLALHLENLIKQVTLTPFVPLKDLEFMSPEEKNQVLYAFNETAVPYPRDKTIQRLFLEQAQQTPDRVALVGEIPNTSGEYYLSYRELNTKAGRLALVLTGKGLREDNIVGILMERSIEMAIGLLGTLLAGAAYLPMDPGYPQERIDYMLKDSNAKSCLTHHEISTLSSPPASSHLHLPPWVNAPSTSLAYIIYTSGTTGKPKGVMIRQRSLVNLCSWHNRYYDVRKSDHASQYANTVFDASVWEIFPYLVTGAAVYIVPPGLQLEVETLNRYFESRDITIAFLPTQFCQQFMEVKNRSLRKLLTGGDSLRTFIKRDYELHNNYGPTENTVVNTSCLVNRPQYPIPIGRPIDNNRVYILDKNSLLPQPLNIPGELCIGGDGLARGYLNNPELTAEKFIPGFDRLHRSYRSYKSYISNNKPHTPQSPLTHHHSPLYHTGDLARWLPGGNIQFLGRIDQQVKIRGFRIELEEIENQLLTHAEITRAAAAVKIDKKGEPTLCAYIVTTGKPGTPAPTPREFLAAKLPGYMIPAYFVFLETIPLTPTGKVARKSLPEPGIPSGGEYTPPRHRLDEKLVEIWAEVLALEKEKISIDANFFHLGGHSLLATTMAARIHKRLQVHLPLLEIFRTSTIRGLSHFIRGAVKSSYNSPQPLEKQEYYALSPAQKRLYTVYRLNRKSTSYNILFTAQLQGVLRQQQFQETFRKLITLHESLRTSFTTIAAEPVQRVHDTVEFKIETLSTPGNPGKENYKLQNTNRTGSSNTAQDPDPKSQELRAKSVIYSFIRPFDLSQAPLLRVGLSRQEENKYLLMIDIHHIVSDGLSIAVLVKNFLELYEAGEFTPPVIQYKDFSVWQNRQLHSGLVKKQGEYWLERFKGEIPILELPIDFPRPAVQRFEGQTVFAEIDEILTARLKSAAAQKGATLYMMTLTIFILLLSKYTGQHDIIVGSPVAGRRHADLEQVVGVFLNVLLMRNTAAKENSFAQFLAEVKDNTLQAFDNQDYPFDTLATQLNVKRDAGRNPLYEVIFALQNLEMPEFKLPGLTLTPLEHEVETLKTDLRLGIEERNNKILMFLSYSTVLFRRETAEGMLRHYREILEQVVSDENINLADIKISYAFDTLKPNILRSKGSELNI